MDFFLHTLLILALFARTNLASILPQFNGTGGTFPVSVYKESTFQYQFASMDIVYYAGIGSTGGKCNIQGYWHTSNPTDNTFPSPSSAFLSIESNICTDNVACVGVNGVNSVSGLPACNYETRANGKQARKPLVDFAGSDSLLGVTDYTAFPDLMMFPAVAGAVVPIYNIPELVGVGTLVLSRYSIAKIFLGRILTWNHPSILADNKPPYGSQAVYNLLQTLSAPINMVVREDSSGTSEVFATSVALFDPCKGNPPVANILEDSFGSQVAVKCTGSSTPTWCDPKTDEVFLLNVVGCDLSSQTTIMLSFLNAKKVVTTTSFDCGVESPDIVAAFASSNVGVNASRFYPNPANTSVWSYRIGFSDRALVTKNWYRPVITSSVGVVAAISTLQEGGYTNGNTVSLGTWAETHSIFIKNITNTNIVFTVSFTVAGTSYTTANISSVHDPTVNSLTTAIKNAMSAKLIGAYTVTQVIVSKTLMEYQIATPWTSSTTSLSVNILTGPAGAVYAYKLLDYKVNPKYGMFYSSSYRPGYSSSGGYVCYRRGLGYIPWTFYTGFGNPGVVAEVVSKPYSIGYSVLEEAIKSAVPHAKMINLADKVVEATSDSVTYAVMQKGGNLNDKNTAIIADSSSEQAWPISGFTYFILRTKAHLGSCKHRQEAVSFLYDFYFSDTVNAISKRLGFSTIPNFIRDTIIKIMINSVYCSDGVTKAFQKYFIASSPVSSSMSFQPNLDTFLSSYKTINPLTLWSFNSTNDDSTKVWGQYAVSPDSSMGTFTVFSSKAEKLQYYTNTNILTMAFAHVPITLLYHLNAVGTSVRIVLTPDILGKIYCGVITYWDDAAIVAANAANVYSISGGSATFVSSILPHKRIIVIVRSGTSDVTALFVRYLTLNSPTFKSTFGTNANTPYRSFNFSAHLSQSYTVLAASNPLVDYYATYYDGSIGFFFNTYAPNAQVSKLMVGSTVVDPMNLGASVQLCQNDTSTSIVSGTYLKTHDLMISSTIGCYPIVGTVDFAAFKGASSSCTALNYGQQNVYQRVQFGAWIYNGSSVVLPLNALSIGFTDVKARYLGYRALCDIKCNGLEIGYSYCNYRVCSWVSKDYIQLVSSCDAGTAQRTVSYKLKSTVVCQENNPKNPPPGDVNIQCTYAMTTSSAGIVCYIFCAIGTLICFVYLVFTYIHRNEKIIKKSQPVFTYIFIVGAILMNLSVIAFVGPDTDSTCMLRPWFFDVSSTIMFAPLLMKLRRVFKLLNNPTLKRVKISDTQVLLQCVGIVVVDIVICILWSIVDTPKVVDVDTTYTSTLDVVTDSICSTTSAGYGNFEIIMLIWKTLVLAYSVYLALKAWNVPSDYGESKAICMGVYNVAVCGGVAYFLANYVGATNASVGVILRVIGITMSATLAVGLIMTPKLLVIEGVMKLSTLSLMTGGKGTTAVSSYNESRADDDDSIGSPSGSAPGSPQLKSVKQVPV